MLDIAKDPEAVDIPGKNAAHLTAMDADPFLDRSAAELRFIAARVAMVDALRRRRSRVLGLSQAQFASRVGSTQSEISRMETGDPVITLDRLIECLVRSGSSLQELGAVLARA